MPRSLTLLGAAVVYWLALAGSASAADFSGTVWTVGEGKFAGTGLYDVNPAGIVRDDGPPKVRGQIKEPNEKCSEYHFYGAIGGKLIREEDCIRVVSEGYSQHFLIDMSIAIDFEQDDPKRKKIKEALESLSGAYDQLRKAHAAGTIGDAGFDNLQDDFFAVTKLDRKAKKELKDDDDKQAEEFLEKALKHKRDIVRTAPDEMKYLQAPHVTALVAEFQPASFRTVYTENVVKNPDGRTLTYAWTLVELNDPPCVNFQPNQPLANEAIWNHPDTQCNHALEGPNGHQGVIAVVVNDGKFSCTAVYFGSNTGTSTNLPVCSQTSIK